MVIPCVNALLCRIDFRFYKSLKYFTSSPWMAMAVTVTEPIMTFNKV